MGYFSPPEPDPRVHPDRPRDLVHVRARALAQKAKNGSHVPLQEKFHRAGLRESQKRSRRPVKQRYEISPVNGKIGLSPPPELLLLLQPLHGAVLCGDQ